MLKGMIVFYVRFSCECPLSLSLSPFARIYHFATKVLKGKCADVRAKRCLQHTFVIGICDKLNEGRRSSLTIIRWCAP